MSRPLVSVYDPEVADSVLETVTLPAVFTAPIRSDVVHYVHTLIAKNARQAYAVSAKAGMEVSELNIASIFFNMGQLQIQHPIMLRQVIVM